MLRRLLLLAVASLCCAPALASDLDVSGAWIRLLPGDVPAAGYFELRNRGTAAAELTGATSSAFAEVMLHRTSTEAGQSRMMHVEKIDIAPGRSVAFTPGGYHLMMMEPRQKLSVGTKVPVTLQFAGGEKVTAQFEVRGPAGK